MCGQIGWLSKNRDVTPERASTAVAEQYEEQHARGTRGFGITEIMDNGRVVIRRATEPIKMLVDLRMSKARHLLLHHRSPTSSENRIDQTHPFIITNKELKFDWIINHNGVIGNAKLLKPEHEKLGYEYLSQHDVYEFAHSKETTEKFNDSESFAIEFARFYEGKSESIKSMGTQAFMAVACKDGKVVKVIIGTNGGNPMGAADMGDGFLFASLNPYGEDLKTDQAITYVAVYDKKGLKGFKEMKELPELIFHKPEAIKDKPVAGAVKSPWPSSVSSRGDDDYYEKNYGHRYSPDIPGVARMGFGFGKTPYAGQRHLKDDFLPALPAPKPADAPETVKWYSFGQILNTLRKMPVGEVFRDVDSQANDAMLHFDYAEFAKRFATGKMEEAEDMWDDYLEDLWGNVSVSEMFSDILLEQVTLATDTEAQLMESAKRLPSKQMSKVAKQVLPIFKLQAFVETALAVGYMFAEAENPDKSSNDEIIADAEQFASTANDAAADTFSWHDDRAKHFGIWGKDHKTENCKAPHWHIGESSKAADKVALSDAIDRANGAFEKEPRPHQPTVTTVPQVEDDPDEAAELLLQALGESAYGMDADEIISEAGSIGDNIHTAASVQIEEHLKKMREVAAEEGIALKLPFYENKISGVVNKAATRFYKLATIVDTAKLQQVQEESGAMPL